MSDQTQRDREYALHVTIVGFTDLSSRAQRKILRALNGAGSWRGVFAPKDTQTDHDDD
jgi:hypothetical protein